jgi:hypothetical protein
VALVAGLRRKAARRKYEGGGRDDDRKGQTTEQLTHRCRRPPAPPGFIEGECSTRVTELTVVTALRPHTRV